MSSCSTCGGSGCSCLIQAGTGITVEGSGTPTNPYVITSQTPELADTFRVRDTPTVNMTITGSGTTGDPYELRAESTLKLSQLADVQDPQGGPSAGESPVWVGTGATAHWEFSSLPPAPAGSVNVKPGLTGLGSVADPIGINVAGIWGSGNLSGLGTDSTIGLETYIDSAGKLRVRPITSIDWSAVANKPTTFNPSTHTHTASQISDPQNLNVGKINGRRVNSYANSTSLPTTGTSAFDLAFFPKGT